MLITIRGIFAVLKNLFLDPSHALSFNFQKCKTSWVISTQNSSRHYHPKWIPIRSNENESQILWLRYHDHLQEWELRQQDLGAHRVLRRPKLSVDYHVMTPALQEMSNRRIDHLRRLLRWFRFQHRRLGRTLTRSGLRTESREVQVLLPWECQMLFLWQSPFR